MQLRLLLLGLVLLLIPVGIVAAQSSTNYVSPRFVTVSGDSAGSASFSVTSVIGQPATDVVASRSYKVSGGFLFSSQQGSSSDIKMWLPLILK